MKIKPRRRYPAIQSLADAFEFLIRPEPRNGYTSLYRGHFEVVKTLQPSLFRKKEHRRAEKNILRELIAIQPTEFREDRSMFDQLVRMQHFGLPTRLLDLTYNPLVGLYFACSAGENTDGELLRFRIKSGSIKYFDSDTVSCVANLSNLSGAERNKIRSFTSSQTLKSSEVGTRLLHFIKAEKPYFVPKIQISHLKSVFAVRPKQSNRRILAQQGAFLIFGLGPSLADTNSFGIELARLPVPSSAKTTLLRELDRININASTLFPEIESAAKYIMSTIEPD